MNTRHRSRRTWLIPLTILLVAFVLRSTVFAAIARHPERLLQPDSHGYHRLAVSLVELHRFGTSTATGDWRPEVNRTPLYPAFLALDYLLFGAASPSCAVLVQVLVSTLTVALAYRLGGLWGGRRVGALVALVLSVEVGSVIYARQLMTETLFDSVFTAGMLLWSPALRRRRWSYACAAGALLGMGALVRPVLFYFGPLAAFLIGLLDQRRELNGGAAWGAYKCLRARRWDVLLSAGATIAYFALVTGPVSYDARYRIPVIPFMALLAAWGRTHSNSLRGDS